MSRTNPLPDDVGLKPVLSGTFIGPLKNVKFERREKFEQPEIMEPNLVFVFFLEDDDGEIVEVTKYCTIKTGSKSNLSILLKSMAGKSFDPKSVYENRDTLWEFVRALIGKNYSCVCQESDSGTYTKIISATPVRAQAAAAAAPAPSRKQSTAEQSFSDDDVDEVNQSKPQPSARTPRRELPQGKPPLQQASIGPSISYDDDDIPF